MMISGSWWYGSFMTDIKNFDWGIFLFPGNKFNAGSGGNLWIVPANSKNKDLAYDWIARHPQQKGPKTSSATTAACPSCRSVSNSPTQGQRARSGLQYLRPGAPSIPDWPVPGLYNALVSDVQDLINGKTTPAQMLDAIATFYNQNKPAAAPAATEAPTAAPAAAGGGR